jgi:hypothetical protein
VLDVLLAVPFVKVSMKRLVACTSSPDGSPEKVTYVEGVVFDEAGKARRTADLDSGVLDLRGVVAAAAGYAAEMIHRECDPDDPELNFGAATDFGIVLATLARVPSDANHDHAGEDGQAAGALSRWAAVRALHLVNEHWKSVKLVASALRDRGELTWDEMCHLVEVGDADSGHADWRQQ